MKGNLELIVGLILTLILKYQISLAKLDDDDDNIKDITPKQALLAWCKMKIPRTFPMNNFNKDWNDGRAIACLVDAVAPGLFPACEKLDPSEAFKNARQSLKTAEKWLGIPQVITPEDITNPNVDELRIMTYVSYFPTAKLKPGANTDARKSDDPTAVDAEWKKIQQNTFTRWCNEHLKHVNMYIYNLEKDLNDGLKLIALLQVLSHKKIKRYNKRPSFRPQKLENIAIALRFIENEQIKLVNIDASDIYKGNLKLILGLIWTLILKYQISLPMIDDDDNFKDFTPKQALLAWCKKKIPQTIPMNNFNKDWNDGRTVACLVHAVAPGLFPECEKLNPSEALANARQSMKTAEKWLGIPQVITPEEITNPNVGELSVMTYVSYFPEAKLKPGVPLQPRVHTSKNDTEKMPGVKCRDLEVIPKDKIRANPSTSDSEKTPGAEPKDLDVIPKKETKL